jgi:hypothetical protein
LAVAPSVEAILDELIAIVGLVEVLFGLNVALHGELQGLDFTIEELD